MPRHSEASIVRAYLTLCGAALLCCACGEAQEGAAQEIQTAEARGRAEPIGIERNTAPALARDARTSELANPDDPTMVFLYHDLAAVPPPIDQWTEEDRRVMRASGADKAARRATVKAEIEAGLAAVRTVGFIRLSMNANLSEYDPTYEEFTVRALSPSSVVAFEALRRKISLKFGNGRAAQIWRVPPAQAQMIRDTLGRGGASLDVLLGIIDVQPSPEGGTIVADVLQYELRAARSGAVLARVRIAER